MTIDWSLLERITQTPGAPGFEDRIRALVQAEVEEHADQIRIDGMGNLIAFREGRSSDKKVMLAAHMDEIGFVVTHIDEGGFVRFHTLGGFDPKTLSSQRVIVHGRENLLGVLGTKPIHVMSAEDRKKMPETTDFFIDLGLPVEKVKELVAVGDSITRVGSLEKMGDCVMSKSLDNRISVYVLIEALRAMKTPAYDTYAVFTVQEEVGLRGVQVAAHHISPDFGIALDTTIAFDVPSAAARERITELGKGCAIKIMDSSAIADQRMVAYLKKTADAKGITWQPEILTAGGTDTAGIQRMATEGAITGALSIPTRHIHQTIEMCHSEDILSTIKLLVASLDRIPEIG